jgi:hypothetical protein
MTSTMPGRMSRFGILGAAVLVSGCGVYRTPMLPPSCQVKVSPTALDFGLVLPGDVATRQLHVRNVGGAECTLSDVALSAGSDAWFAFAGATLVTIAPGASADLSVSFQPAAVMPPLTRTGVLGSKVDSPDESSIVVPLTAEIQSDCRLDISPTAVDFGRVALDDTATKSVQLTNKGKGPCEIRSLAIAPKSDSEFHLDTPDPFVLDPGGQRSVSVSFTAKEQAAPHHRTGNLEVVSNDNSNGKATVPLSADIDIGCQLSWLPTSVDFGNVILNTTADGHVSLSNDGTDTCSVSDIAITADSHPAFRVKGTATSLTVAPGASAVINLTFTASDSTPPHLKTGTLAFQTGNKRAPSARVPLSAYVNSVCVEASQWIYTVDEGGLFSKFDPSTLKFTDIATLRCPTLSAPNSMAVDQNAVAWVAYQDGNMFKVDTTTGACEASGFKPNQHGLLVFGMGFVFDPSTGLDTLYIAGGASVTASRCTLATVSFPGLVVTPVGTVEAGLPEMTGTGDGQLWGFIPLVASTRNSATLLRLDPKTGATLESHDYTSITGGGAWAMKFWGGSFWIFLGDSVYKVSRDTPEIIQPAIRNTNRRGIVGAGVSTCAPLQ